MQEWRADRSKHEKAAWDHSRRLCVSCEMCDLFVSTRQYIRGRLGLEALERIDPEGDALHQPEMGGGGRCFKNLQALAMR